MAKIKIPLIGLDVNSEMNHWLSKIKQNLNTLLIVYNFKRQFYLHVCGSSVGVDFAVGSLSDILFWRYLSYQK